MSPTSWRRWRIPSILRRIATSIRYGSMLQITRLPVSTRLIFIASVFDVAYTNFRIYKLIASQYGHSSVHRQEHCKAAMWGTSFFALLSVFSRALLSFHLQLVVIHKVRHAMTYEYRYLCGSVLIALLLSLLPLSKGGYGWVDFEFTVGAGCCGYFSRWATIIDYSDHVATVRFDTTNYSVRGGMGWMWGTYFGWIALTVAYSCIVIIIVLCKIIHDRVRMVNAMQGQAASMHLHNERREFLAVLLRATRRIAQFPALVVFCHSLEVAWGSITVQHILSLDTGRVDVDIGSEKGWFFAMQVVLCFQGILTLSFLPFETPIRNFLNAWIEQIRDNHTTTKLTGSNVDDDDDGDDAADRRGDNYGWRSNSDLDPSSSGQRVVCPPASASKQHAKQPPFLSRLFSSTAFREARLNSIVQMQAGAQIPYSMANNQSYVSNAPARTPCRINFATINSPDDLPWDIVIHEPVVQEPRSGRPLTASPHAAIPTLTFVGSSSNSSGDGGSNLTTPFNVPLTAPVVDNAYLHPLDHHHHYYHHRHGGASPGLTQKRGYRAFIEPHRRSSLTNVCFPPSRDSGSSISSFATNRADSAPTKCSIHTLNAASAASPLQDTADSPDNGHSGTCRSASSHAYAHNT
ncbi:hypothetical protein EV182_004178 [Spiromyces aspiralis]|uniref:Uncharacterized protein n=1 Tax=Spiromyces aspiralis TaxID=68401 RepID=A0ACC1HT08_9FUNG|nr:hypothetical protein EV182_004178 [Spiromyces aspiralis]